MSNWEYSHQFNKGDRVILVKEITVKSSNIFGGTKSKVLKRTTYWKLLNLCQKDTALGSYTIGWTIKNDDGDVISNVPESALLKPEPL
jgi:uncharacterized Zn ribbon protein